MNDVSRLAQLKRLARADVSRSDDARRSWAEEVSKAVAESPTFVRDLARPLNLIRTNGFPEDLYLESSREIQSRIADVIDLLESNILDSEGRPSAAAVSEPTGGD